MKVIVTSVFRDKFTHRLYNRGDSFDIKDEARVQDLESRKLAERVEVPEEKKEVKISLFEKEFEKKVLVDVLKGIGVQVTGNMGEKTLLDKVAELDEEAKDAFYQAVTKAYLSCKMEAKKTFGRKKKNTETESDS